MVMASDSSCRRQSTLSFAREAADMRRSGEGGELLVLHDRLVAYVHAIDNPHEGRSDVWVEHSYAVCGRGAGGAGEGGGAVRELLGARADADAAPDADVDVETAPPPPPSPPPHSDSDGDEGDEAEDEGDDADDWEARLAGLAPHADHARLAAAAVDCLRRVRLAKLAGGRFAERAAVAEAARRLRLALAPLWAGAGAAPAGPGAQRPAPWLHAALPAVAPRAARRLYERVVAELRRRVPRLAARLAGPAGPAPTATALRAPETEVGPESGPWLVWLGGGRWPRLLRALVHTRVVPLAAGALPPDAWCAAVAGAARAALADILHEAGSRGVVVGGCGGGAALAGALAAGGAASGAAGGAVRGALLLSPALLTAEGPREGNGRLTRGPALVVAGSRSAAACSGALRDALAPRQRLLLVRAAGHALRLPAGPRRRRRLAQRALDAAVAEECARWVHEACEARGDEPDDEAPRARRGTSAGTESSEEEFAHLPVAHSPPVPAPAPAHATTHAPAPAPAPTHASAPAPLSVPPLAPLAAHTGSETRSIEIVEGRVVSRVSGGTPLALLPPRRAEPRVERRAERRAEPRVERRVERRTERRAEPPVPLAAADIMQLPIVFADDERTIAPQPEVPVSKGPVTVTSGSRGAAGAAGAVGAVTGRRGALRYTRVIVAKRAAPAPAPASAPRPPLLVRRGLRLDHTPPTFSQRRQI